MPNVAVLIDAENVLPVYAHQIFENAAARGAVCAKEIYGAAPALTTWVEPVFEYAMHANLTIKASKWKNSSDITLVIGAMDLLIAGNVDTVILVSSDSDFSALSVRLRLAGLRVVGMGTEKANDLWRKACSEFVMLQPPAAAKAPQPVQPATDRKPQNPPRAAEKKAAAQPQTTGARPQTAVVPSRSQPAQQKTPQAELTPAVEEEKKSAEERRVASTHAARTEVIRDFIRRQIDENHGKMALSVLFQNLRNLREYQVDQRGSKRKPLNYLMWLFSDAFSFEDAGSGGTWISLKAKAAARDASSETAEEAAQMPTEETPKAAEASEEIPVQEAETGKTAAAGEADELSAPEKEETVRAVPSAENRKTDNWAGAVLASIEEARKAHAEKQMLVSPKEKTELKQPEPETENLLTEVAGKMPEAAEEEQSSETRIQPEPISLYDIGLQNRPLTTLVSQGYHTLEEVAKLTDQELMAIKNIGVVTVDQIRKAARKAGL